MFRKKAILLFVSLSYLCLFGNNVFAQNKGVKATLNPDEILIGQQATLQLDIEANKGTNVVFPQYQDTLVTGVEVLKMFPMDTIVSGNKVTYSQRYLITSFDSATYTIPYVPVIEGLDTLRSNEFTLDVKTVQLSEATQAYIKAYSENPTDSIDVAKLAINDIKPIQKPPFVWQDYLNYILIGLLILLILIGLGVGLYLYLKKKNKGYFFKPKVVLPPHIVALSALDSIKDSKMWQQGREKEYYTDLTDILRRYIEDRFGVPTFEKTSDEILSSMQYLLENDSTKQSLSQLLNVADLVKFAKYKPLNDENDLSLMNAYLFINQTKKEEIVEEQDIHTARTLSKTPNKKNDNKETESNIKNQK